MEAMGKVANYVGYHGTSVESARRILVEGFRQKSVGYHHWLGDGFYFFESSASWARWWIDMRYAGSGVVLRAEISVERHAVLDLLDYDDMRRFQEYRTRVIRELRKRRKRVWKQRPWDGYVINMLCIHGGIRVVRAAFPEPEEHVDDTVRRNESRIRRIHIQLCCRDPHCITSVSLAHTGA